MQPKDKLLLKFLEIISEEKKEIAWSVIKPGAEYTEEELKQTPIWQKVSECCSYVVSGKKRYMPDYEIFPIIRNAIDELYKNRIENMLPIELGNNDPGLN